MRPGIVVHRSTTVTRRDRDRQLGIPVTSPAGTLLDVAPRLSQRRLRRVFNDAQIARRVSADDVLEILTRLSCHPGAAPLRALLAPGRGPTRSELEDAFQDFIARYELPLPKINHRRGSRELDALFEAEGLIVELDGRDFHTTQLAFEADRERDAANLAAGLPTVRLTWARLAGSPAREAERLHRILAQRRRARAV